MPYLFCRSAYIRVTTNSFGVTDKTEISRLKKESKVLSLLASDEGRWQK